MPTLDDLRDAFAELERRAPMALLEPVPRSHRRRWVAVGVTAACTAAVAIAVPLTVPTGSAPTRSGTSTSLRLPAAQSRSFAAALPAPTDGQSPDLAYGFAIPGTVAGYTVIPDQISGTHQHASIYPQTDPSEGDVWVFYGGAFDASSIDRRDPVSVAGQPGYYATVQLPDGGPPVTGLVWEYADDGWAVVGLHDQTGSSRTDELSLAEAMIPADDPARSPVRLPSNTGARVEEMSTSGIDGFDGGIDLAAEQGTWHLGWSPDRLTPSDKPNTSTTEIAGREWIIYSDGDQTSLGLISSGWGMTVVPPLNVTLADLEQFVAGLQFAPVLADQSTWFDADTALP